MFLVFKIFALPEKKILATPLYLTPNMALQNIILTSF